MVSGCFKHTCAQCSLTSVGLAQAHPNNLCVDVTYSMQISVWFCEWTMFVLSLVGWNTDTVYT